MMHSRDVTPEAKRPRRHGKAMQVRDDVPGSISAENHRSTTAIIDEDASNAASQLLGLPDRAGSITPHDFNSQDRQARFVGDLNPEGILIEAAMAHVRNNSSSRHLRDSSLGIWKEPQLVESGNDASSHNNSPVTGTSSVNESHVPTGNFSRDIAFLDEAMQSARTKWIETCLIGISPSDAAFQKLREIYLKKIQPIFPIFDEKRIRSLGSHRIDRAIKLVVCLAASTDHEARGFLCLQAYPSPLSYQEFSAKIAHFLRMLIQEIDFSHQLVDQIRILSLMALYWQPLEEQEWDAPARLFAQAVSIAHSLGLHLEVYHEAPRGVKDSDDTASLTASESPDNHRADIERLFLCIYSLDRMIGAFYGRPILISDRDFDRDIMEYASRQPPCFRLFIHVIWELNEVTELYRPFSVKSRAAEVSVFERLILDSGAQNASPNILATIEVFHHAVSALSVRQTRQAIAATAESDPRQYPHLPEPLLNARRSISADRILQIVKQYDVGPLPFIPYALSISLSVAYRKWRFSQIAMFRARGRAAFLEVLPVLEEWGRVFTSARINHNLAQKVVEGMEKVAGNIKRKQRDYTPVRAQTRDEGAIEQRLDGGGNNANATAVDSMDSVNQDVTNMSDARTADPPVAFPSVVPDGIPLELDVTFSNDLADMDLFHLFDETTNLDVGEMDSMFDRNLDPMAPTIWPVYPSWDPDRTEGTAFFSQGVS